MRKPIELLNAHLDGQILTSSEAEYLSAWVAEDASNARTVVEFGVLQEQINNQLSVPRLLDQLAETDDSSVQQMIGSALQSIELQSAIETRASSHARGVKRYRNSSWFVRPTLVAASLLLALGSAVWLAVHRQATSSHPVAAIQQLSATQETLAEEPRAKVVIPRQPVLATISESLDAKWDRRGNPHRGVQIRRLELFELQSGVLALTTSNGCDIVIQAPASVLFEEADIIQLLSGKLTARIGGIATGLTIKTPTAEVVDLGTEFGVSVDASLATSVAVYEGVVELTGVSNHDEGDPDQDERRPKKITAGRAGYVDPFGTLRSTVETLPHSREFIRIDELAAIREAKFGSEEAKQQVRFYQLQRIPGLVGFQGFDVPSNSSAYTLAFEPSPIRSEKDPVYTRNIAESGLYSSGAIEVREGSPVFLGLDTSSNSAFARAGLLTDRGLVGRSGAELWLSWKTKFPHPKQVGSYAGMSLMFGDERLIHEPLFVGISNGKSELAITANVGSRSTERILSRASSTSIEEQQAASDESHSWVMRLTFGERADKIAIWCDVPASDVLGIRPQAEIMNAYIMFDRLRLGVGSDGSPWRFDDICIGTNVDAIVEAIELLQE